ESFTVAPKDILLPERRVGSMISARESLSSRSLIRASIHPWRSLAAWYSAFSLRSPCSRAKPISRLIFGRSTSLRFLSSSLSRAFPSGVMGILPSMKRVLPHVPPERPVRESGTCDRPARPGKPGQPEHLTLPFGEGRGSSSSTLRRFIRLASLLCLSAASAPMGCVGGETQSRGALHY